MPPKGPRRRYWHEPTVAATAAIVPPTNYTQETESRPWAVPRCEVRDVDPAPVPETPVADQPTKLVAPAAELAIALPFDRYAVVEFLPLLCRVALLGIGWALFVLIAHTAGYQALAEPGVGGALFDTAAAIVFASVLGNTVAVAVQIPGIATTLLAGVLWAHLGPEVFYLTRGIPPHARKFASLFAVSVIVTRAGLAIRIDALRRSWRPILGLAVLPLLFEATAHAVVARYTFADAFEGAAAGGIGTAWAWAFLQGLTCSPIAPGVVVPGYIALKQAGFGTPKNAAPGHVSVLDLLMGAVVLDAVVGLWAANFCSSIVSADPNGGSGPIALAGVLGPIQFIVGLLIGCAVGVAVHFTATTWLAEVGFGTTRGVGDDAEDDEAETGDELHTAGELKAKGLGVSHRVNILITALAVAAIFGGDMIKLPGGASIAVAAMAATVANLWHAVEPKVVHESRVRSVDEELSNIVVPGVIANALDGPTPPEPRTATVESSSNVSPEPYGEGDADPRHEHGVVGVVSRSPAAALHHEDSNTQPPALASPAVPLPPKQHELAESAEDVMAAGVEVLKLRLIGVNAWIWDAVALPLLFSLTGAGIDLTLLFDGDYFTRAIGPVLVGALARLIAAALIAYVGSSATVSEAVYAGFAWTGKGAVQAALATIGFTSVVNAGFATADAQAAAQPAADAVQRTALLTTVIFAPLGCVYATIGGRFQLRNSADEAS